MHAQRAYMRPGRCPRWHPSADGLAKGVASGPARVKLHRSRPALADTSASPCTQTTCAAAQT
eukprot:6059513-Alexandrium_andersonii.AAC.1